MPKPAFAAADTASLPLHVVPVDRLAGFLAAQPPAVASWLTGTGFDAAPGDLRLIPAADGTVQAAVMGMGSPKTQARGRFHLAKAAAGLPAGVWHLESDLTAAEKTEAALAFLLQSYRFDRYRPGKSSPAPALLKPPEGIDANRILAMAEGEFLTRDLINTPALDMGPAELEAAFLTLADTFGATTKIVRGDDLLAQNFPMIHAVGRASTRAPRLLEMNWGTTGPHLTRVG